jgi:hypothetical protein
MGVGRSKGSGVPAMLLRPARQSLAPALSRHRYVDHAGFQINSFAVRQDLGALGGTVSSRVALLQSLGSFGHATVGFRQHKSPLIARGDIRVRPRRCGLRRCRLCIFTSRQIHLRELIHQDLECWCYGLGLSSRSSLPADGSRISSADR